MLYQSPSLANQLEAEETVYKCRDTTSGGRVVSCYLRKRLTALVGFCQHRKDMPQ